MASDFLKYNKTACQRRTVYWMGHSLPCSIFAASAVTMVVAVQPQFTLLSTFNRCSIENRGQKCLSISISLVDPQSETPFNIWLYVLFYMPYSHMARPHGVQETIAQLPFVQINWMLRNVEKKTNHYNNYRSIEESETENWNGLQMQVHTGTYAKHTHPTVGLTVDGYRFYGNCSQCAKHPSYLQAHSPRKRPLAHETRRLSVELIDYKTPLPVVRCTFYLYLVWAAVPQPSAILVFLWLIFVGWTSMTISLQHRQKAHFINSLQNFLFTQLNYICLATRGFHFASMRKISLWRHRHQHIKTHQTNSNWFA